MIQKVNELRKKVSNKQMGSILVLGDLMLDEYHWCKVNRISPEAPVPVCKIEKTTLTPGGAGNVANNIKGLNIKSTIFGFVGADSSGDKLVRLFEKSKIDCSGIIKSKRSTILKSRVVAHHQQVVRLDREDNESLSSQEQEQLFSAFESQIASCSAIVISDYLKGTLTESFLEKVIELAKKNNKTVVVDPKGDSFMKYKNATIITPNFSEFETAIGKKITSEEEIFESGKKLVKKLNLKALLLTRSEKGMSIITKTEKKDIKTDAKEVFDITGAGDTVVALLTIGLACNLDLETSARMANIGAGIVVEKRGTATVSWEALETFFTNKTNKKLPYQDLNEILQKKEEGKQIVFTNGCFDILHAGHVQYLTQAKSHGDILVVGLNSDQSVKNLKGSARPINNQTARASVLASLEAVDYVVTFEEDTPINLIQKIKPDVHIKGGDYNAEELPEFPIISNYGGKVIIKPFLEGFSTSSIIEKISS